jgi:hypothetical protein
MPTTIQLTSAHLDTFNQSSFQHLATHGLSRPRIDEMRSGEFLEAVARAVSESSNIVYLPQPMELTLATGVRTDGMEANFSVMGRFSVPDHIFESELAYKAELASGSYVLKDIPLALAYFSLVRRHSLDGSRDLLVLPKKLCRLFQAPQPGAHAVSPRSIDRIQCRIYDEMLRVLGGSELHPSSIPCDPDAPYCIQ